MTDLSPAAQAVVNAAVDVTGYGKETPLLKTRLAAALRALADQVVPEEPTELTDQELLRCFKIATPCYNVEGWQRELDGMRAAIAADRARYGNRTPAPEQEVSRG